MGLTLFLLNTPLGINLLRMYIYFQRFLIFCRRLRDSAG